MFRTQQHSGDMGRNQADKPDRTAQGGDAANHQGNAYEEDASRPACFHPTAERRFLAE